MSSPSLAQTLREARAVWRRIIAPSAHRWLGLIASVMIGVASLMSVESVLFEARGQLQREARDLLGADLTLNSWRPLEGPWIKEQRARLAELGDVVEVRELASMVQTRSRDPKAQSSHHDTPRLVTLKGVGPRYPLRGALMIAPVLESRDLGSPRAQDARALSPHGVWVASSLWETLAGRRALMIGSESLRVEGVIVSEPDAGISGVISFAPRVMVRHETLQRLGLIAFGSRVRHKLLFARSDETRALNSIEPLIKELRASAPIHITLQSSQEAQPNTLALFTRIGLFFTLISLVALALCLIAFLSSAWGTLQAQLPLIATARSIGVSLIAIRLAYGTLLLGLGALGGAFGFVLSLGLGRGLSALATAALGRALLVAPHYTLLGWSMGLGLTMAILVNWGAQRALTRLSPQALWSEQHLGLRLTRLELSVGALGVVGALSAYIGYRAESSTLGIGFALALGALALLVGGLVACMLWVASNTLRWGAKRHWPAGLLFALRQLLGYRIRAWLSLFTLGISCALIGGIMLVSMSMRRALTLDDATLPHVFLVDIQPDQRAFVREALAEHSQASPLESAIVRARLSALRGERITREMVVSHGLDDGYSRALRREYSVTSRATLSSSEELVAGRWWSADELTLRSQSQAQSQAQLGVDSSSGVRRRSQTRSTISRPISVEQRYARRMRLDIGDTLTLDIQGRELTFEITSIRAVNWLSFTPNFLFVTTPRALARAPQTWVSAAQLRTDSSLSTLSATLFRHAPNINLIDLRPALTQIQRLLAVLNATLALTGGVCVLAGLLALFDSVRRERRERSTAIKLLGDLGVSRARARRWVTLELTILGGLSALTVTLGALSVAGLATSALRIPLSAPLSALLVVMLICIIAPPLIGSLPSSTLKPLTRRSE